MEALVGVVIGGLLTAIGSLIVGFTLDRRARDQHQRDRQIEVAGEALTSLQLVMRKLIDVARTQPADLVPGSLAWDPFHEAITRWNSARYAVALISPAPELRLLDQLDREIDRLTDLAIPTEWDSRRFRQERQTIGTLAAEYLTMARVNAGQEPAALESLWSWDNPGTGS